MGATEVEGFRSVRSGGGEQTVKLESGETVPLGEVKDVYAADQHYIVFTDPSDGFWYANDSSLALPGDQFNALWNRVQEVKALPMDNAMPVQERVFAFLATAVSCAFENDYTSAIQAVEKARATLMDTSERRVKTWYMPAAATVGSIACLGGLWFFLSTLDASGEEAGSAAASIRRVLAASIAGGSLGAMLSALGPRRSSPVFDPFANRAAAWTDGALRILYGIVTAFVVTLAVEVQFVSSALLAKDTTKLSLLLVAIAGGFLERWAVDIIRRVRPGAKE